MALKRLRLIQRRKALGYTQKELAGQLGCERTTIIRWERAETEPQPWLRPKITQLLHLTAEELGDLLADVADVPDQRDGFTLVSSVPLDFSLSAAHTVRVMEGFSAHDIASRREALAGLAVMTGVALVQPVRQWAASLTLLAGSPPGTGADEVSELEQAVTLFRSWDAAGAGGLRRKAVVGQLNAVAESLGESHRRRSPGACFRSPRNWRSWRAGWLTTRACSASPSVTISWPCTCAAKACLLDWAPRSSAT
jgi:DNA-binding XRE family transcriptional regulator